jgi:hypothetical protein
MCSSMGSSLKSAGFANGLASSTTDALRIAKKRDSDLVIAEIPVMD